MIRDHQRGRRTFAAFNAYTHHPHPKPPLLYPNLQPAKSKTGIPFLRFAGQQVLSCHALCHLGLEYSDYPIVFGELRLQVMTQTLLDQSDGAVCFARLHECCNSGV